jgi:hypothetical protein
MKELKILLRIIKSIYNKYTEYTQKQLKTQIKDSYVKKKKKTRFSLLSLMTKITIFRNQGLKHNFTRIG